MNLDLDSLSKIYLVANTPGFLYREMRKNDSVVTLAMQYTSAELSSMFQRTLRDFQSNKEVECLVTLYAIFVALTIRDDRDAQAFILSQRELRVEWIPHLFKNYASSIVSMETLSLSDPGRRGVPMISSMESVEVS